MEFLPDDIEKYCQLHTSEESDLLKKVNRETHLEVMMPRMLSGHLQGQFLKMISCLAKPMNILEIGTYTGYSALCLAEGLRPNGKLVTIDVNQELRPRLTRYFKESKFASNIDFKIGNALELVPELDLEFDLVFIDADKVNYLNYYQLVIDKTRSGGLIMADNVLWSGKVVQELKNNDKETKALLEFNRFIQSDPRVENMLLPLRDGIMMARKL